MSQPTRSRPVYRSADLQRLLAPRSVCIVGASPRVGAFGERALANLSHYDGVVTLVNSRYQNIAGRVCYPSLAALPDVPDCVVLAVGRDVVEEYVLECARLGVGGVIVFASGYAETGQPEHAVLQARLSEIASTTGLRILGPSCMGLANYAAQTMLSFVSYSAAGRPRGAAIGVASQSGAMSNALGQAVEMGVSFSHVLSSGNSCDVDVADLIAWLADDADCRVIACVFEGMADPRRFMAAARIAFEAGKPLVVCKLATGNSGAQAAASHTGSLAGSNEAYLSAFAAVGAIVAERFEDMLEIASFFAKAPTPKAPHLHALGVAVISTSGGAAIMAADAADAHHVAMPQPGDAARVVLQARIPEFGSSRNPCDVTAQVMADSESLAACAQALLDDPAYGVIVMAQPQAYEFAVPRISAISLLAQATGKMACNVLVSQWLDGPGAWETEIDPRMALFRSMDRCFATIKLWHKYVALRQAGLPPDATPGTAWNAASAPVRAILDAATNAVLTERVAKQMLNAYGIPTVLELQVQGVDAAVRAAQEMGYPVVMKAESPDLPHKTEAGVVQLDLRNEEDVRGAHALIVRNARAAGAHVRLEGVLVQQMVPAGLEIMVGARRDPQFGPLVVVGIGGVMVELLRDTAVELAPVTRPTALAMLARLKGAALLRGFRSSEPINIDALADIVCRLSALAADHPDIEEIDVNPLICSPHGIVAVDALIVTTRVSAAVPLAMPV
jgi:acyl-CoA synthetase (NDP forming)